MHDYLHRNQLIMKKTDHSVAEVLLAELSKLGVEYVFLVPGAQIIPLVFRLYEEREIKVPKPIIANHELAAGFMAIGYARASGKMGVAISIGGPGAAFMVGAGVTAKIDDVPVLFITGNIPPDSFGAGEFQDASPGGTNDSSVFKEAIGISMACNKAEDLKEIIPEIKRCNDELRSIHVQIPISIQKAIYPFEIKEKINNFKKPFVPEIEIDQKVKTVLLIGQKALRAIDPVKLLNFVKKNQIGVVTDMKSRGILSEIEMESLGYIGFNSDVRALEAFNCESPMAADQIITVGVSDNLLHQYINVKKVETKEIDPQAINSWIDNFSTEHKIVKQREYWLHELNKLIPPQPSKIKYKNQISYSDLIETLKEVMPKDTIYSLDSGQIRRAGSIFLTSYFSRTLLQSETLSPMGLGICASIGAQLARPEQRVVCLFGDGSMRMNGIELSTAVRYNLPIIFILCDNKSYASIKAPDVVKQLPDIDWTQYGDSFGIQSHYIDNREEFSKKLNESLQIKKPVLLWTSVPGLLNDELAKTEKVEYKNWLSTI